MFYRRLFDFPTRGFRSSFRELDRLQRQMEQWHGALSGGAFPMPSAGVFPLTLLQCLTVGFCIIDGLFHG